MVANEYKYKPLINLNRWVWLSVINIILIMRTLVRLKSHL